MEKKLFLLDAFALIYRAHYAFINRPLRNSKGMNVSAVTGFTNTLWELLQKQKPTHIGVVFDLPGPTFRHEMYEEYKANRQEQPEDITISIPIIKELVEAFNIPVVAKAGYEADDLIGTLAKQAEKEGFKVYMMTPDKDYAQLVSENIFMYKPARSGNAVDILGEQEVLEKWNIQRVEQVIDILGLQGDAVDNIPGVKGIGPKTAQKLLAKYDSVEGILEHTHELKGKQKEYLETGREQAILSKTLATIAIDAPIQFDAESYAVSEMNREKLLEMFRELEFRSISKKILQTSIEAEPEQQYDLFGQPIAAAKKPAVAKNAVSLSKQNIDSVEVDYQLVDTAEGRKELIAKLKQQSIFCFDTETSGLNTAKATLVGLSFAWEKHKAYYVPTPADQAETLAILEEFRSLFEEESIAKIGQNIKYDALILRWYGVEVKGKFWDTMLMHYLLKPESKHNMNYLAETYLDYSPVSIETLIGKKGKNQLSMRDLTPEQVYRYACEDADVTWQLKEVLDPLLKDELRDLYWEVEEPLIKVLVDIEREGINLNADFLLEYEKELAVQITETEQKVFAAAGGRVFNLSSPSQVGTVLFEQLELPYRWRKTKTGKYSTNEEKLTELAETYEIVADIMHYRHLAKLRSTYVAALPRLVNAKSGRIHTTFMQGLTATGRLSSQNPNLQNIPMRTKDGRAIRKAFVPRDEQHVLLAADYSQIELRLVAELSKDATMLAAFKAGKDIHTATAAGIYEVALEEVTKEQRYAAKTVNFSIIYGAGATNISKNLGIKRNEAKQLIEQYYERYSDLKSYMDRLVEEAREEGFVRTLKGRRRYLPDINSRNGMMRSHAERNAVNTPIQGTAADMIKIAMIKIAEALKAEGLKTKMILQVHDELIFDVPKEELEQVKVLVEEHMRQALPGLDVPIVVGMDSGANWLEAH